MTVVAGRKRRRAEDNTAVQRLNVFISDEAHQRLMVNSAMEKLSPGLLLERLINDHCRAWNLPAPGPAAAAARKSRKAASANPDDTTHRPDGGAESSQESIAA